MHKNKRSFKNFLIDPNFQFKYALYFASSGVVVTAALAILISHHIDFMLKEYAGVIDGEGIMAQAFSQFAYDMTLSIFVIFIFNLIFSFAFAVYMTHRVVGPARAIENTLREIAQGNYDAKRTLRKNDSLRSLMLATQDLAAVLKRKEQGRDQNTV